MVRIRASLFAADTHLWCEGFLRGGLGSRGVLIGVISFFAGVSHPWFAKIVVRSPPFEFRELAHEERTAGFARAGCDAVSVRRAASVFA